MHCMSMEYNTYFNSSQRQHKLNSSTGGILMYPLRIAGVVEKLQHFLFYCQTKVHKTTVLIWMKMFSMSTLVGQCTKYDVQTNDGLV